jgi:asparagine synthase (glutamine-hydrolysing)
MLAHTRLAIIDLHDSGSQPMLSVGGRRAVAFNGEIYNYKQIRLELEKLGRRFRSTSDTEVLLQALEEWGTSACHRFEGMFAFAYYDEETQSLTLGRDRSGQKPLYFTHLPGGKVAFASELRVLLGVADNWALSRSALEEYLRIGYTWSQGSLVDGIEKVEPGSTLVIEGGSTKRTQYWELPDRNSNPISTLEEAAQALEGSLQSAVERALVSDVSVGVLLSGGVDSSLVAALAARTAPDIRSYTVSFEGSPMDESGVASRVAASLGLPHIEIRGSEFGVSNFVDSLQNQDEPIADPSVIAMNALCRAVSQHTRVVLGGDGGDELFGGYLHYQHLYRLASPGWVRFEVLRRAIAGSLHSVSPRGMRGTYWLEMAARPAGRLSPPLGSTFSQRQTSRLLVGSMSAQTSLPELQVDRKNIVDETMRMDFKHYLPNDILHKVDRCAMRFSLEVRSPFLDSHVIELGMSQISPSLLANAKSGKLVLKMLRQKVLGDSDELGRKQGFSPPLQSLLASETTQRYLFGVLHDAPRGVWNNKEVQRWTRALEGGRPAHLQVYSLAAIAEWQRQTGIFSIAS